MGHVQSSGTVLAPRMVGALNNVSVETVVCSDGATVVLTTTGELVALVEFGVKRRIVSRKVVDVAKIEVRVVKKAMDTFASKSVFAFRRKARKWSILVVLLGG